MSKKAKLAVFVIALLAICLIIPSFSNAATPVTDEETLKEAIASAKSGDTITLENDITVTGPVVIENEVIINGNGHTVTGSDAWTSTSGNQTMFTAQLSGAKVTLKNITLKNGPKYGVQSYEGASVVLDGVTISGFNYGGVLVNAGKVEVKNLNLGSNGTGANNGIEIDRGVAAVKNPTLVMNGVLKSSSNVNVVRLADNGQLEEFTITNDENTSNKVFVAGNKLVLTDFEENVISETTIPENVKVNAGQEKIILSIVNGKKAKRTTIDAGSTISSVFVDTYVDLEENEKIEGYYVDDAYTNKFDFSKKLDTDTTIYVKVSKEETTIPDTKPETKPEEGEKDDTPKTGIVNYVGVALAVIALSTAGIVTLRKKNI